MPTHRDEDKTSILYIKEKYEQQLLDLTNVVGVGRKRQKTVIKVFVSRKVPETLLKDQHKIPDHLEGYETDIEVIGFPEHEQKHE
ncbi:hypothetical protein CathTA2_1764 [Caldalkalibacillus thermarum TA2.A1]|uniref:Uncharacterized protein n=1 Tax=Caldalkalibacillus thermarum (strain TA2.A1) TaxID=986075 RepID=F5L7G4_CALTT|nr:hypothetical protein [Caldalkalibacillus thermarum]EGL82756.1 hypothetical protein CathTA2_1764 [Caldalkalibacillus thermarum TA2.A1]QZT32546.1 hypothetical protein HUR95_09010 [Caldalkalibacillus thermarum TA2.A1]